MADFACYLSEGRLPYLCMTYRLNTDRLVLFSVLLWGLLPPGLFAWGSNPPTPDNVRWAGPVLFQLCGIPDHGRNSRNHHRFCVCRSDLAGAPAHLGAECQDSRPVPAVRRDPDPVRRLPVLCAVLFAPRPDQPCRVLFQREQGGMTGKKGRIGCPYFSACLPPEE